MNPRWQWLQQPRMVVILVAAFVFCAIMALRVTRMLEFAELEAYDFFLRSRPNAESPDPRIVLIGVTERDIQRWGWPLSDAVLADLLERLASFQPRVIGLDIFRDHAVFPGRQRLQQTLTRHTNIIGIMTGIGSQSEHEVAPPPVLAGTDRVGFADMVTDANGVVRRGLLYLDDHSTTAYSFALRIALAYLQRDGIRPQVGIPNPEHLQLGQVTLPPFESNDGGYVGADAGGYQFLLDFDGALGTFITHSVGEVLGGKLAPRTLQDKIVIVGVTAKSVKDYFYTPFSLSSDPGQRIFGIALHGHAVSQLLRTALSGVKPIRVLGEFWEAGLIWLWTLGGGLLGLWVHSIWRFSLSVSMGLVAIAAMGYGAMMLRWWIPVIPPAVGWLTAASLVTAYISNQEKVQRGQLMQLFSRYISSDIAKSLWQQRHLFLHDGRAHPQKLMATVFFSDLKGFTAIAEQLDPDALMEWLNDYMKTMAQLVIDHGGIVDKFMGDAIMAIFGVPLARTTETEIKADALQALACAMAMGEDLNRLNREWRAQGLPTVGIRMGIFTGPLIVGSLGSSNRMEYTALGDTVNIAARLESFDKEGGCKDSSPDSCRILIGDTTMHYVAGHYHARPVGNVNLKGKQKSVTVFEIIGRGTSEQTSSAQEENHHEIYS